VLEKRRTEASGSTFSRSRNRFISVMESDRGIGSVWRRWASRSSSTRAGQQPYEHSMRSGAIRD
jgi:hypothetical protein